MMPLAGPRSLTGPTRVLNGSLPKLLLRNCVMSCVPGVSALMASCTASLTSAPFMPTSSVFLCCQSNRSGKYIDGAFSGTMTPRCGNVGGIVFVCAGAVSVLVAAAPPVERVSLETLLERAGWYLYYFVDEFENVVAEETYIQDSALLLPTFSPVVGGRGGVFPPQPSPSDTARARHRELRSDFLLAKSPATEALVPFRDVIEVDGVPVRDRE